MALFVVRMKEVKVENLFSGFKNYVPSLVLYLLLMIFTVLWSLLFIIPGIIKAYSYSMSWYILADNPQMSANQARKRSMELMKGNKWRLFCLHFSYIGWFMLGIITLGILYFWITPYIKTAEAEFYRNLVGDKSVSAPPSDAPAEPFVSD